GPWRACLASLVAAYQTVNAAPHLPSFRRERAPPAPRNRPPAHFPCGRLGMLRERTMRYASVAFAIAIAVLAMVLVKTRHARADTGFLTRSSVMEWMDGYRNKPEPSRVPAAVKALSEFGALRE